jgi:hypothetical protein
MEDSEEELFITPNSFLGRLPDFELTNIKELLGLQNTPKDISPTVEKHCNTTESSTSRFGNPISDRELDQHISTRIPKNTERQTEWALRVWRDWAKERNKGMTCTSVNSKYQQLL